MGIDISDMDSFLGNKQVNISDMDNYIASTTTAPPAPQMEHRVEGGGSSLYSFDSLKKDVDGVTNKMTGVDFLASLLKDTSKEKGELTGASAGAITGLSYASKVQTPNPIIKALAMGLATGIGGGLGYVTDKKDKATPKGTMRAAGESVAGEMVGMGVPIVAKKVLSKTGDAVSSKIAKYIYGDLDPQKAKDILELASSKGVRLLPNQVADNKAVDQLLSVIGQNPVLSQKINTLNKGNKTALLRELNDIINRSGVDSVALRSADDIDPLGRKIKDYLGQASKGRTKEIQNAYKTFENYGGAFTADVAPITKEITALKKLSSSMPNPDGYTRAVDYVLEALKEKPEVTSVDLNNVIKQINYNMKHLGREDFAIESGYKKMKGILDGHLETLAKQDGSYEKLNTAKKLYATKREVYDRPEIRKILSGKADDETIYNTLLRGNNSITNAKILRDELLRTKDGEKILGTLARRQIDEALYKTRLNQNIFKNGELDSKAFLKVIDEVDYRQLEILGGKAMVNDLHELRGLVNLINKQDKVLAGEGGGLSTMGILKGKALSAIASILRIRTIGEVLTSETTHQKMLSMLRKATKTTNPNKVPQAIESIEKNRKEIIDALR